MLVLVFPKRNVPSWRRVAVMNNIDNTGTINYKIFNNKKSFPKNMFGSKHFKLQKKKKS